MKIVKKKTKNLKEGDILILDLFDPALEHMKIIAGNVSEETNELIPDEDADLSYRFEGNTMMMLFQIDKFQKDFVNGRNNKDGVIFSLVNTEFMLYDFVILLIFGHLNFEWDVIENPFETLQHYKDALEEENEDNDEYEDENNDDEDYFDEEEEDD